MSTVLTDAQIKAFLADPKPITEDYRRWLDPSSMRIIADNLHCSRTVTSVGGTKFGLYLRQNKFERMDFSVGLRLIRPVGDIALIRCNGWHEEHRNKLDKTVVPENTCHVHIAQEKYFAIQKKLQRIGHAQATSEFQSLAGALEYLLDRCTFVSKKTMKPFFDFPLFRECKK